MNILDKYKALRSSIKDGNIILFHGTGLLAKLIQNCDENNDGTLAYHNHVGIVVESHGALFIVDSNEKGVQADRLSWRINKYRKGGDFTIIQPSIFPELINIEMRKLLHKSDDNWIKYDFINGAKELLNRKFGFKLKINLNEERDICSDYVSRYACNLDLVTQKFEDKVIVFPEDYIRFLNKKNAQILK